MVYVRFPLSLRNVEGLLDEPGEVVIYESVQYWLVALVWAKFASLIKKLLFVAKDRFWDRFSKYQIDKSLIINNLNEVWLHTRCATNSVTS